MCFSVPEQGLRLRAGVELGEEYAGKRTSRRVWASDRGAPLPRRADGATEAADEEDDEAADEADAPAAVAPRKRRRARAATADEAEDADAAAVEAELEAVAAAEAAEADARRSRAAVERRTAAGVLRQRRAWETSLGLRIRVQRAVAGSEALPRGRVARGALRKAFPPAVEALDALAGEAAATVCALATLLDSLLGIAEAAAASDAVSNPSPLTAAAPAPPASTQNVDFAARFASGGSASLWSLLSLPLSRVEAFAAASIDAWHARTAPPRHAAANGGGAPPPALRALHQPPSAQVAAALADPAGRMRARAAPLASAMPRRLGEASDPQAHSAAADARDFEGYDDAEFYAELLRELVESGDGVAHGGGLEGAAKPRTRKVVDRRASKGRKLRYAVYDKLVSFVAPVPREEPPNTEQLFRNLFGQQHAG